MISIDTEKSYQKYKRLSKNKIQQREMWNIIKCIYIFLNWQIKFKTVNSQFHVNMHKRTCNKYLSCNEVVTFIWVKFNFRSIIFDMRPSQKQYLVKACSSFLSIIDVISVNHIKISVRAYSSMRFDRTFR